MAPLSLHCPKCPRLMTYIATSQSGILVYQCEVHGEWHLGPGGIYDPKNPPPEVRALFRNTTE